MYHSTLLVPFLFCVTRQSPSHPQDSPHRMDLEKRRKCRECGGWWGCVRGRRVKTKTELQTRITNRNHKQESKWKPTIQQDLLHACSTVRGGQPIAAIAVRKHVAVVPGCFVVPSLVGSFVAPKPGVFRRSKSIQHLLRKGKAEGQC